MKVAIVTGANGFVGHHLVEKLSGKGYRVIAMVRNRESFIGAISHLPNVEIVYCEMSLIEQLLENIKIDTNNSLFFHLAWTGSSGTARADYQLQLENAKFTVKAAYVAKKLGCKKIIVAGSITQLMYRDYLRLDEITPEAVTAYAVGKIAAENMLKCVCAEVGLEYNWAYISNFYGADDPTTNFINFLIEKYSQKETPILTEAEQLADFVHVEDVAEALIVLAEKGKANNSYYIGYGKPRPLKYFIQFIHQRLAPDIESGIGKKKLQGLSVDFEACDYKKMYRDTGFEPKISFEDGIGNMIVSFLKV